MKTAKILLSVLLTLLIVVVSLASETLAVVDLTLLNPNFYEKGLDQMGFYENVRVIILNEINSLIDQQGEDIPEKFRPDAYQIAENVFAKDTFSKQMGTFLGGAAEYVLHGDADPVIPIKQWYDDLNTEIESSTLVEDIVDYEIEIEKITEDQRDYYISAYQNYLHSVYTSYIGIYASFFIDSPNLSDVIKMFAPTPELQDSFERQFWIIRYWVARANIAAYIGFGISLVLMALLFLLWKKNIGVAFKIIGIFLIVNSGMFILIGIGLFLVITIANLMQLIPPSFDPYISLAQSITNPLAMIALGTGIIVLVVGIILSVLGGAFLRKKAENENSIEQAQEPLEIQEITYEDTVVEIVEEETSEDTQETEEKSKEDQ